VADVTDFNPVFGTRLNQLRDALTQAGIGNNIVSGYRSPEYQGRMYANHLAQQSGQPLPYPNDEAPAVVAPPWRSFHNYGLAADFNLANPNDYARLQSMAPQYGLTGIGMSDKGHIQLAGSLADDIAQYHLANWRPAGQPAPAGAVAYTGPTAAPSRVASTAPGTSLSSSPMDIVLNAESGDRNIANTHATTSSGQAQGYPQITTGTWTDFAPKAGVDLKQYPMPMDAPRDVQIKVASQIPLNRWASSTVNAVLAKYPGIDTSQPLGAIQSAAINPSGASTVAAGAPAAAPATGQPAPAPANWAGKLATALKPLSGDKGAGGAGGQTDEPPPMRLPQAQPAQAMGGPMMMGPGGQNFEGRAVAANNLAQQGFSMQPQLASAWGALGATRPPVPTMTPGQATGIPGLPGTTLNSPSQLQMALMTGAMSPYDMYANAGMGGGYGST
jgi:hypothetical protein